MNLNSFNLGNSFQRPSIWQFRTYDALVLSLIVGWSCLMLAWTVLRGVRHDYVAYLGQWLLVREFANPWFGDNTYGPLHIVLAFFAVPNELGPKIFMTTAFITVNFLLLKSLLATRPNTKSLLAYAIFVPLNFLVISIVFSYGLNDSLVAALIGLGILARFRTSFILCGVFLGLAVLLKYYPALLIPFFCLNARQFNWRLLVSSLSTMLIGFFTTWLTWGWAFIASFSTGADRGPKLLSILSALQRNQTLGTESSILSALIYTNALAVVGICCIAYLFAFRMRFSWIEGAAFALLLCLVVYKVGHPQFYIPWLFLLVGLLIQGTSRSKAMAFISLPYVVFLSAFQFGYEALTDGYNSIGGFIRDYIGFYAFALGSMTIVMMLINATRSPAPLKSNS